MKITTLTTAIVLTLNIGYAQKQDITIADLKQNFTYVAYGTKLTVGLSDGEHFAAIDGDKIKKYTYKTGEEVATIMDLSKISDCPFEDIEGFSFSDDEQKILIYTNSQKIYRYSFTADYFVYDTHYNELKRVSEQGQERDTKLSPDGTMVAYVSNNNLYLKKLRYDSTSAITTDGDVNKIINGAPDWVYEEEFTMTSAFEWSDDSKQIAFVRFDENEVKEYTFPIYNVGANTEYAIYPGTYSYKYPKAGEKNSEVSVHVYNIQSRQTKTMDLGDLKNRYVPRIKWTATENQLAIYTLNRRQNQLDIYLANTTSTVCKNFFTDKSKTYIDEDVLDNSIFLPDGNTFIYTGEEDGWNHIYVYGTNGVFRCKLTQGEWDVTNLIGYNQQNQTIYYQAARTSPLNRDVYAISIDGKTERQISSGNGTTDIKLSATGKYYQKAYSDTNTPPTFTVHETATNKTLWTIQDNKKLKEKLQKANWHKKEFIKVPNADGTELNAWIVKPTDFDNKKEYPLLMVQYSGPGSQEVLNKWTLDWEQTLASEGYIVACVDGRGTGCRGDEFKKCTYQHLGQYESDDQIAAAKYFATLPYIDAERIGIWGWSFGGFMSSLCLCRSDVFKAGIAIAPVTSWRFYDSIYTERFMRTPQENISGYDKCNPLSLANQLSGHLFLIHGTADDNVHLQNQAEFTDALIRSGKQFDMFCYPNKNHSIKGGNTRMHLYTMLLNWVKINL